ncbi:hypothetical protein V6N11_068734 [Hibiscus sabdariffa]|uniref:non-specific serine/threonine protein kinase n=1 Tax=Hibiscus sabdariffa TaxID=183260 RepID=A0ABR2PAN1_9ROSI
MGKTNGGFVVVALISCFYLEFGTGADSITPSKSIKDPEAIISEGGVFGLGFFSLANSSNRYVGILYNQVPVQTVVWVANRNKPLMDFSGILNLSSDGNIVVLNGKSEILWSSNVTNSAPNTTTAQLLDSGNLVLYNDDSNGVNLWESFQHPSNAFLQTMKISTDVKTGQKVEIRSWKSPDDPSEGNFSLSLEPFNVPECVVWNNGQLYFRTGPWNGHGFIGMISMYNVYLDGFSLVADSKEKSYYFTFELSNTSLVMYYEFDPQGQLIEHQWDDGKREWLNPLSVLLNDCDIYGKCGAFGVCDSTKRPICSCLKGFEPRNVEEWRGGNWSGGCVRTTLLQCQNEGFLKLKTMKVPAFPDWLSTTYGGCEDQCKKNCSCVAYAYDAGIGCMFWSADLIDVQKFSLGGVDLFLRLPSSELGKIVLMLTKLINVSQLSGFLTLKNLLTKFEVYRFADKEKRKSKIIVITTVIPGVVSITIFVLCLRRWMAKKRGRKQNDKQKLNKGNAGAIFSRKDVGDNSIQDKLQQELPLFRFKELATATNDFHRTKKLGQGNTR